jgi:hypothetical protein
VKRDAMLKIKNNFQSDSISNFALSTYNEQNGFNKIMKQWKNWKIPICMSFNGVFIRNNY